MNNYLDLTKFKTCTCGVNIESDLVDITISYTWIGWFFWSMGTTAIPKEIIFRCKKCDLVFDRLSNKEIIKYYIFYRKH